MTSQDPTTNDILLKLLTQLGNMGVHGPTTLISNVTGERVNPLVTNTMPMASQAGPTLPSRHISLPGFSISQAQPYYCYLLPRPFGFQLQQAQSMPTIHPGQSIPPQMGPMSFPLTAQPNGTPGQPIVQLGNAGTTTLSRQATTLLQAFTTRTLHDPTTSAWNMDTADGTLSRYKARLVANVSTHLEEVEVDETLSPNAFLHGDLSETAYMHQPPGFWDSVHPDYVCFRCDSSLFIYKHGTDTAYLLLYVDDIILKASSESLLQQIIRPLHQEFAMTDLSPLNYFLGISVTCDSSELFLSQKKYVIEILDMAHMDNCNLSRTPIDTESKLGSDGDPVSDPTLYRSLACSLQYLTFTRPDISYAVQQLFSSSTTDLVAYSNADWAGFPTTRRSTLGYCVFLGNNLLSWSFKRQPTLSRSSAEAECYGVANAVAETCWLRNLLRELHTLLSSATLVYCDNVSAVYLSCNPVQHQRTNDTNCGKLEGGLNSGGCGRVRRNLIQLISSLKARNCFWVKMQQGQYPTWVSTWLMVRVCGFLYLEIEVVCVEFGCHFEVEPECEFTLSSLDVLQGFSFFLQMGFTLIMATLEGLDVGLLGDIIGEDDFDDDG
ncbi:ribonuclease H-like domain-containing protein [Tanacetum coccineum]